MFREAVTKNRENFCKRRRMMIKIIISQNLSLL
jgi:hypothetical protein